VSRHPPLRADKANTPAGQSLLRAFERLCALESRVTRLGADLDPVPLQTRVAALQRELIKIDDRTTRALQAVGAPGERPEVDGDIPGGGGKLPGDPPDQTPPNVVPNPGSRLSVVLAVNAANPGLINQSCLAQGGNFGFLDAVITELRKESVRWGYLCRRTDCSQSREDALGYYAGNDLSQAQQSPVHYAFDIIRNHCPTATSGPEEPQWNDVTGAGGAIQNQVNRWKYPR
jgi:hypothetical protein